MTVTIALPLTIVGAALLALAIGLRAPRHRAA
jgi:hypothetical protein